MQCELVNNSQRRVTTNNTMETGSIFGTHGKRPTWTPQDPGTFYALHLRTRVKAVLTKEHSLWTTARNTIGPQNGLLRVSSQSHV
jgi:hypothetical protein